MHKLMLTKQKLEGLVTDEVLNDATLANIDPELKRRSVQLVLQITSPGNDNLFFDLQLLATNLLKLRYGEKITSSQTKAITQDILKALLCPANNFQEGEHYKGARIVEGKKGKLKCVDGKLLIKFDMLNAIIMSAFNPADDPVLQSYLRCYERVLPAYRRVTEATRITSHEKETWLKITKKERTALKGTVEHLGINPVFGIMACVDKKILQKLAPGPSPQKEKIKRARCDEKIVHGSCSAELNPAEQGYRAFALSRVQYALRTDAELQELSVGKEKRARTCKLVDDILQGTVTRYHNVTDEEQAKLVYDPTAAVRMTIQNSVA